jgi:hypothetical protein
MLGKLTAHAGEGDHGWRHRRRHVRPGHVMRCGSGCVHASGGHIQGSASENTRAGEGLGPSGLLPGEVVGRRGSAGTAAGQTAVGACADCGCGCGCGCGCELGCEYGCGCGCELGCEDGIGSARGHDYDFGFDSWRQR